MQGRIIVDEIQISAATWEELPKMNLAPRDVEGLLAELKEYHSIFGPLFGRTERGYGAMKYMQGQMLHLERKSIEPMALAIEGDPSAVQSLQQFIGDSPWSDKVILLEHQRQVDLSLGDENGVVIMDSSEFPKKGVYSIGVARQHCGQTGKVDNCQSGMFLGYASSKGHTLVAHRLFVPERWFEEKYAKRRRKCAVPEDITFQTKPELGWDMVKGLVKNQTLRFKWVTGDSLFGRKTELLDNIDGLGKLYLMEVPVNTQFWEERPTTHVPPRTSKYGKPPTKKRVAPGEPASQRADRIAAALPTSEWKKRTIREGTKGPIVYEFAAVRAIARRDELPGPDVWLLFRRSLDDKAELRAYVSNAPADTFLDTLIWVASRRWCIETVFEEGKQELGMGDYQVRGWRGWHHHMTMTCLSHHFLVRLRLKLGEQAPALTVPQVRELLNATLPRQEFDAQTALKLLKYRQQRNYAAYRSHRKRKLKELRELVGT